jgi:hypothetical protein
MVIGNNLNTNALGYHQELEMIDLIGNATDIELGYTTLSH